MWSDRHVKHLYQKHPQEKQPPSPIKHCQNCRIALFRRTSARVYSAHIRHRILINRVISASEFMRFSALDFASQQGGWCENMLGGRNWGWSRVALLSTHSRPIDRLPDVSPACEFRQNYANLYVYSLLFGLVGGLRGEDSMDRFRLCAAQIGGDEPYLDLGRRFQISSCGKMGGFVVYSNSGEAEL